LDNGFPSDSTQQYLRHKCDEGCALTPDAFRRNRSDDVTVWLPVHERRATPLAVYGWSAPIGFPPAGAISGDERHSGIRHPIAIRVSSPTALP
jgi:hypothetical protein